MSAPASRALAMARGFEAGRNRSDLTPTSRVDAARPVDQRHAPIMPPNDAAAKGRQCRSVQLLASRETICVGL